MSLLVRLMLSTLIVSCGQEQPPRQAVTVTASPARVPRKEAFRAKGRAGGRARADPSSAAFWGALRGSSVPLNPSALPQTGDQTRRGSGGARS